MPHTLQGYYPIVPTCYEPDGQVDLASMRRLTNYLIENGAQGMSPNGGDSEARYLKPEERMRVLDVVMETNNGRTPVLVGTSAPTTEESVQLTQHAERAGASAVFVMPPEAWRGTLMEEVTSDKMLAHYAALCEGLEIPLMIHAIKSMDVPFFETLLERFPQVRYIKEETSHGIKLRQYVRQLSDRVTIFGPGLHYPAELEWGARGVMPSCCAPHTHARVFDLWEEGNQEQARREWNRMLPLVFWRWHTASQEAGKMYLMEQGVFQTRLCRPDMGALKLDEADRQEMLRVLATMGEPY